MIFVSFNYRLGPLGFLSTGNNLIPGNLGLKDQVLALKWVEENIEYFHGNKNSITLSGFSSGAASAEFHLFSPLSKGLFQRAILHSGSALALWATLPNPLEKATLLANTVGCLNTSLKYMVECLKERPAALLVEKATAIRFTPVVEPEGSESFLTETPRNLIESGKVLDVPILVSYTREEGLFFCNSSEYEVEDGFKEIFIKKFPGVAGIYDRIEDYYLKEETDISEGRLKLVTDAIIRIPLQESIFLHSALGNSDVYCYVFNYVPQTSFMDLLIENVPHTGSSHGDDINLLYASTDLRKLAEEDEKISGFLLDALTSFAKDGVPKISNQQWKPANGINHLSCLEFNSKTNIALRNQNATALQFWKSQKLIV